MEICLLYSISMAKLLTGLLAGPLPALRQLLLLEISMSIHITNIQVDWDQFKQGGVYVFPSFSLALMYQAEGYFDGDYIRVEGDVYAHEDDVCDCETCYEKLVYELTDPDDEGYRQCTACREEGPTDLYAEHNTLNRAQSL